ncbi:MAG: tetratricopeptide repeat protein [Ignavibacteria bacterium]|nr:tetratricopeptide repeat protein [Ignavibacteria bacterium]
MIKFLVFIAIVFLFAGCSSQQEIIKNESQLSESEERPLSDEEKALQHFIEGSILESKGDYAAAILEFQDALRLDSGSGIHYALAKNYNTINKIPLAIQHSKEAIKLSPDKVEYYDLISDIFYTARQYDSAAVALEKVIELDPSQINAYYKLARIYESSKPLQAIEIYNKLTSIIGPEWSVLIRVAELHENLGNLDEASEAIEELLTIDPSNTAIQKLLTEIYTRGKKYDEALKILSEIIEFTPDDLDARERKAQILIQQGDWKAAAEQFNYVLEQQDISLETKIRVGASYFAQSLKDTSALLPAKQFFERIDKDTTDWQVKLYLGAIALSEGDDSLASKNFKLVAELAPWNPQAWVSLGGLYFDNQHYKEAAKVMKEAVQLHPQDFVVNLILGLSLAQSNNHLEAKEYLKTASQLNPNDLTALSAYGYTLSQLKETEEAIRYLKKALVINPDDVNILGTLGLIYDSVEMWNECDTTYERALEIDSINATINNNYAYSLSERDIRLEEALEMAKIAIEKEPFNSSFLDTIGWVYFKLEDYEKAKEYLEKALEVANESPVIMDHLGDVLFKMGNKNLALELWQKAYDLDTSNTLIKNKIEKGEI